MLAKGVLGSHWLLLLELVGGGIKSMTRQMYHKFPKFTHIYKER